MNFLLRKTGYLVGLGLLGACALVGFRGPQGIPALMAKRQEIRTLQERNADLASDNLRKKDRIEKLRSSQAEQELEIRKRLKLLRPGETSFILPERPQSAQ